MKAIAVLLACAMLAACVPNPRNEIPAVLAAAVSALPSATCVEREVRRFEAVGLPGAPVGFADLRASRFRGGGGIKGAAIAGVLIRHHPACYQLYGPVIADDRALVRAVAGGEQIDVWLRRTDARWHAVMPVRRIPRPVDRARPVVQ